MKKDRKGMCILLFIAIAVLSSLPVVLAQAGINCTLFPRTAVPGTFVPMVNVFAGNDSHVEFGNLSNYDLTIACNSSIAVLNNTCSGTSVSFMELYQSADSHVSVDGYYAPLGNIQCLSTMTPLISIHTNVSVGTPANYDCAFGLFKENDSHVYDCDAGNLNFNIKVNASVVDTTDPVTTDNHTLGVRDWYIGYADIELDVVEPNFDYTEFCWFSIYGSECVPTTRAYAAPPNTVTIPCPEGEICQVVLTYHSVDVIDNNESYHNTTQINIVNGSHIEDSLVWNSTISEDSVIIGSEVNDSNVSGCTVINSIVVNSTIANSSLYGIPCHIENSTILDSQLMNVKAIESFIDPSVIVDSIIINSTVNDSNITSSIVGNSTFCAAMELLFAHVSENVLTAGEIYYLGKTYRPVTPFETICGVQPNVAITYPTGGMILNGTFNITFTSDQNNSPEISIDGSSWIGTDWWDAHEFNSTKYAEGTHTVRVRDSDVIGQYSYSQIVVFTVQNVRHALRIVQPEDVGTVWQDYEVMVDAPDYIREVEIFLEQKGWNNWSLEGPTGSTIDSFGGDGWGGLVNVTAFGPGGYFNLTAIGYSRTLEGVVVNLTDTVYNIYMDGVGPTGNITIQGSGGAATTNTMNVVLNLTYNDTGGVDVCRYANDAEANLAAVPWEPCMATKGWVLSSGLGEKWVYYEIRDVAGFTRVYNDSITLTDAQDLTPPTDPTVYDSNTGIDVDYWNENESISGYWFGSIEDVSSLVYYHYQLLENGSVIQAWKNMDVEDTDTAYQDLVECTNYSFEVIASNPSNLNSSAVTSDGAMTDFTEPDEPTVESSSHPDEDTVYGESTLRLNFSSQDTGTCPSGIEGYSFELGRYPGSAPDDVVDEFPFASIHEPFNNGYATDLKENGTGNAYAVMSQIKSNLSAGDKITVMVQIGEETEDLREDSNLTAYIVKRAADPNAFDLTGDAVTDVVNITKDIAYAHDFRAASIYRFDLVVSQDVDSGVDDVYVVIAGSETDDVTNDIMIAGSTEFDNSTKNFICDEGDTCIEGTNSVDYSIRVLRQGTEAVYQDLMDGTYYFHVKAKDVAGNWGTTEHYKIQIDTEGVFVDIISPFNGQQFTMEEIPVRIEVNEQADVNVTVYHEDGSRFDTATVLVNDSHSYNVTLEDGLNEIQAMAVNPQNGVATYSRSVYVAKGEFAQPVNKTLRITFAGAGNVLNHMVYGGAGNTVGIATENTNAVFGAGTIKSDTSKYSTKIFLTKVGAPVSAVDSDLQDDEFLDRVNPLFGFERGDSGKYVISTMYRNEFAWLSGDKTVTKGNYKLIIKNVGYTPDGKVNVSVRII
ncbi:hypothetical protein ACFL0V_04935 [Nanoarchaeota archaeon]